MHVKSTSIFGKTAKENELQDSHTGFLVGQSAVNTSVSLTSVKGMPVT